MLLEKNDPKPFRIERENEKTNCIVVCDHAGKKIPTKLGDLGISKKDIENHITYDIGTERLGLYIGAKLNAITFIAHYSRLVIDVNREPFREDSMPEINDGIVIVGNSNLSKQDKQDRIDEIYTPYQNAIKSCVKGFSDRDEKPFFLSIHSFTPKMGDEDRPWEIGVLWEKGNDISQKMIAALRENNPDMQIGDNQPYSLQDGEDFNNTVQMQAISRGLPSLVIEFRQDTLDTEEKIEHMADVFLESLSPLLTNINIGIKDGHTITR